MKVIGQGALHKYAVPVLFIKVGKGGMQIFLNGKRCFSSHI